MPSWVTGTFKWMMGGSSPNNRPTSCQQRRDAVDKGMRLRPIFFVMLVCLPLMGCGESFELFDITGGDDFLEIKAKLEAEGFRVEGRDEKPYIFAGDDFLQYYTFTGQAPELDALKTQFLALLAEDPHYSMSESLFLDSYFLRRGKDAAEAGFCFSAFDSTLLYSYCFLSDVVEVLDFYRAKHHVYGPFMTDEDQGSFSFWYFENVDEAMVIDTSNDPASDTHGGGHCFLSRQHHSILRKNANRTGTSRRKKWLLIKT